MKRAMVLLTAALLAGAKARAQQDPGTLIIAGGGWAGTWDTEIELANTQPGPIEGTIFLVGLPLGAPCPAACARAPFTLPPNGTLRVSASSFIGELYAGPQMLRVTTATEAPLPMVHARVLNRARPSQGAELPVFRESTLKALDTTALVFPGASRFPGVHSNLILQTDAPEVNDATEVLVEAFDREGGSLGSGTFLVAGQQALRATTIVDVLGQLGVAALEGGQIRVTHAVAGRTLWGVLTTVSRDEWLAVTAGVNP